ncbi:MAG: MBL fold metallo-hydrolase [Cyclobacteriaceae bacterium]
MRITFLGTGTSQGVPVIACDCEVCNSLDYRDKRLRSSIFVEHHDLKLAVDSGPDFRQQMLRENIHQLDALLITHEHKDHVAGMDDIRAFNFIQKKELPVYARKVVVERLKLEFPYVFEEAKYPGVPRVKIREIDHQDFRIKDLRITPIEVMHYKMPVLGYRMRDFTYITDANYISETEKDKIKGSQVLVLNALQQATHISHFNLQEAISLVEELKPSQAYLTHISHRLGSHRDVSVTLPDNIALAYDGLKVEVE